MVKGHTAKWLMQHWWRAGYIARSQSNGYFARLKSGMQVVSNAPNSNRERHNAVDWSMLPCRKHVTRGCRPAELSGASSLTTGVLWLWLVPPHIACLRIVHVNTDSTRIRPYIHLPLDADLELPRTLQTRDEKKRAIIHIHFRPLFLRRTASSTSGICLDIASSLNPYLPLSIPLLQTDASNIFWFWISLFFLDVRSHPRPSHPQPRQIHHTQLPESSSSQLHDATTSALTLRRRADRLTAPRPRPSKPEQTTPRKPSKNGLLESTRLAGW